jgi:hypothetical protein
MGHGSVFRQEHIKQSNSSHKCRSSFGNCLGFSEEDTVEPARSGNGNYMHLPPPIEMKVWGGHDG